MSSDLALPETATQSTREGSSAIDRWFGRAAAVLFALGVVARVAPLLNADGRLLKQFPTEDGYLLLTVSRNIAIGLGMTVSEGTIPTNGIQPLASLLWVSSFWLARGDRLWGVGGVLVMEIAISALAAFLLLKLSNELLGQKKHGRAVSYFAAAVWFASPLVIPHTMNCLETGMYGATVIGAALAYLRLNRARAPWSTRGVIGFGALLGLAFWARNDTVFLVATAGLAHIVVRLGVPFRRRFIEAAGFGAVSGVVALPWLIHNVVRFGHLVPISGQSEGMSIDRLENLRLLPIVMAEYFSVVVPVPESLNHTPMVSLVCAIFALGVGTPLVLLTRRAVSDVVRGLLAMIGVYGLILVTYYTVFFGANWFLSRYLFPLSPFITLLWMAALRRELERRPKELRLPVLLPPVALIIALCAGLGYRQYARGNQHEHFQVVNWIKENVPETTWVGAAQSGTLGFFHDRSINLDGKVNPEALIARANRKIPEYAMDKGVDFIADWQGFADWVKLPAFAGRMELLVDDRARNLAVLRRRGVPTIPELRAAQPAAQPAVPLAVPQ